MKLRTMVGKSSAVLLAAALVLSSPGLGSYACAAAVVSGRVSGRAAVVTASAAGGAASTIGFSALSSNALSLSLSPAALGRIELSAQPLVAAGVVPGAAAAPVSVPALPAPAAAPVTLSSQRLLPAPASEPAQGAGVSALAGLQAQGETASQVLSEEVSGESARNGASAHFDGSKLGETEPAAVDVLAAGAAAAAEAGKKPSLLRRYAAGATAGVATGLAGIGLQRAVETGAIAVPSWAGVLDWLGTAGYYIGNGLSFIFAIPQILKTFEDGHHGATPVKRSLLGMAASLALGLVSAPLAGQLFWGVQNLFGGLTMLAPLLVGRVLKRSGISLGKKVAVAATVAVCAALLAVSFGLYAAAAALVPAVLPALLGEAGVSALTLAIQVATGVAFIFLFTPDISAIVKKQAPQGFTPTFSLIFAAASIGFIAWTLQMAAAAPHGSPERVQFIIYAAQNVLYAVVSMMSYIHGRRHEKRSARA